MRVKAEQDLTMPVEMLLVLMIVLHEGGRSEQFSLLAERAYDRFGLDPAEREMLARELGAYRLDIGSASIIRALRALGEPERMSAAKEILDFAASDPLLSAHQRRLRIRVLDILALDDAD
jgi:hypothetical protein